MAEGHSTTAWDAASTISPIEGRLSSINGVVAAVAVEADSSVEDAEGDPAEGRCIGMDSWGLGLVGYLYDLSAS